jgi:hypothetical protein
LYWVMQQLLEFAESQAKGQGQAETSELLRSSNFFEPLSKCLWGYFV